MPYTIVTTTPDSANAPERIAAGPAPSPMGAVRGCWPPKVTRHDAATLDAAREIMRAIVGDVYDTALDAEWAATHDRIDDMPAAGGTVGPLPDGTAITVEYREMNSDEQRAARWARLEQLRVDAEPEPEPVAVRLFEPAPNVMPGQLGLID